MNFKKFYIHFPITILVCEWVLVLYLHYNNPYHFITMSKSTLTLLLLGLFGLIFGYYTMHSFYLDKNEEMPDLQYRIKIDQRTLGLFIIGASVIVTIGLLLSVQEISKVTNGLSLYFSNPFMARERIVMLQEGELQNISKLNFRIGSYLSSLMYPMATLGGIAAAQRSHWKITGFIPIVLVVLYSLLYLNRFGLIVSMGLWFFTLIYYSIYLPKEERKHLLKKIILYTVLASIFVLIFFYMILSIRAFYISDLSYYVKRSFYAYFSGSPAALEKILYEPQQLLYGTSSFRSIAKWLGRLGLLDMSQYLGAHNAFKNIGMGQPMTLNTYTFVKTLFEDFGTLGVAFMTVVWGALARFSIEKCFRKFSIFNLFVVSVFVLSFLMSFYEFFFQGITMFIYWSLILLFINSYLKDKGIIAYEKKQ